MQGYNGKIFVVTNRHLIKQGNIYEIIEKCALKGADGIFLREKDLNFTELKEMAIGVKKITDKFEIPLIINGNLSVVKEIGAKGFHTSFENYKNMIKKGSSSFNKSTNFVIGVSVHKVEEAIAAEMLEADYLIAGNVFETNCKPGLKGRGIEFIQEICSKVKIPVIGIGGINPSNLQDILNGGASGVAIMSYAMSIK